MAAKKNSVFFLPATPFEIVDIVTKLESKSSCVVDGIPINILGYNKSYCRAHLGSNKLILVFRVVPDKLKIGNISPVYKNGEKE